MKKHLVWITLLIPLIVLWSYFYIGYRLKIDIPPTEYHWYDVPYLLTGSFSVIGSLVLSLFYIISKYDNASSSS